MVVHLIKNSPTFTESEISTIYKSPPPAPILSHAFKLYIFRIHINIVTNMTIAMQRPKYTHATTELMSQEAFSMRFAYIYFVK